MLGLHAFEHEGIQNITALKDQLIAANHNQSEAILKRHADVIARLLFRYNFFYAKIYMLNFNFQIFYYE